jgi:hypothetical protein
MAEQIGQQLQLTLISLEAAIFDIVQNPKISTNWL